MYVTLPSKLGGCHVDSPEKADSKDQNLLQKETRSRLMHILPFPNCPKHTGCLSPNTLLKLLL